MVVYRIQPQNAELHGVETETSNGNLAGGVHVFRTLEETHAAITGGWRPMTGIELVSISCEKRDVRSNGDYEGDLLLAGRGQITERKAFGDLKEVKEHLERVLGW